MPICPLPVHGRGCHLLVPCRPIYAFSKPPLSVCSPPRSLRRAVRWAPQRIRGQPDSAAQISTMRRKRCELRTTSSSSKWLAASRADRRGASSRSSPHLAAAVGSGEFVVGENLAGRREPQRRNSDCVAAQAANLKTATTAHIEVPIRRKGTFGGQAPAGRIAAAGRCRLRSAAIDTLSNELIQRPA